MIWLVTNWRLVAYGAAILAIFGLGWHTRGIISDSRLKSALESQEIELVKKCTDNQKTTYEVSNEYQKKITALNNRIAALKLQPKTCVPVTITTSGYNATAGSLDARAHGITSSALYDYAGDAEKYRLQLISCQDFINKAIQ